MITPKSMFKQTKTLKDKLSLVGLSHYALWKGDLNPYLIHILTDP